LPEPEGPTTQTTSRSITGSETRVSTWFSPNRLLMPSAMMMGVEVMTQHKQILCRYATDGTVGEYFASNVVWAL